jgi:hypothetical protein
MTAEWLITGTFRVTGTFRSHAVRLALACVAAAPLLQRTAFAQIPGDVVAHWKLDEGSGTAADSSVNGNNGVLVNGPAWRAAGFINAALTFDGSDDHVVVANAPASLKPTSGYAISAWIKYGATDASGGEIATMGDNYALRVQPTGDVKTFFHNASGYKITISSGVNTKDNKWHHVLGQYTGSTLDVYIDGVLQGTTSVTGAIEYTLGANFYLGQQGTGGTNHNFNGTMDQVRVYARSLDRRSA